jgi:hypothetical protein
MQHEGVASVDHVDAFVVDLPARAEKTRVAPPPYNVAAELALGARVRLLHFPY